MWPLLAGHFCVARWNTYNRPHLIQGYNFINEEWRESGSHWNYIYTLEMVFLGILSLKSLNCLCFRPKEEVKATWSLAQGETDGCTDSSNRPAATTGPFLYSCFIMFSIGKPGSHCIIRFCSQARRSTSWAGVAQPQPRVWSLIWREFLTDNPTVSVPCAERKPSPTGATNATNPSQLLCEPGLL